MAVPFGKLTKGIDAEAKAYEVRDMLRSFAKVMFDQTHQLFVQLYRVGVGRFRE